MDVPADDEALELLNPVKNGKLSIGLSLSLMDGDIQAGQSAEGHFEMRTQK